MKYWTAIVSALSLIAVFVACGERDVAGGSTVETENAISLLVLDSASKPISGAVARARPAWFVADGDVAAEAPGWILRSDQGGRIYLADLPDGDYGLEISGENRSALMTIGVHDGVVYKPKDTVQLAPLGSMTGSVSLPAGVAYALIQVFGLDRWVKTDSLGRFVLDKLPTGLLHVRALDLSADTLLAEVKLEVLPGISKDMGLMPAASLQSEDLATWKYHRQTSVAALISDWMLPLGSTAMGFLRLDSSDAIWQGAAYRGRDLRIRDAEGTLLDFQVALWDSLHKQAVVRVRLDGLGLSDSLTLYWGRPGALNASVDEIWEGVADSLRLEWYSLDVEDFEEYSLKSNLPSPISPHYWYLFAQDTNVRITPLSEEAVEGIQPAGSGRGGSAYHLQTSSSLGHWGLLGLKLDTIARNLSHLDSLVFWVRGQGRYSVGLESLVSNGGKALYFDTLDAQWTRHCLRPQDFVAGDSIGGNVGWEAIRHQVTNLSFFAQGNADFWLDDIRIYGWNRDDLK